MHPGRAFVLCLSVAVACGQPAAAETSFFTLRGQGPSDFLGSAVSSAGDVDQDGFVDLLVGAYQQTSGGPGYALVISGRDAKTIFTFTGSAPGDLFGRAVAAAGDVDGDGFPDVVIGAPFDGRAANDAGSATVFSGKDGKVLYLFTGDSDADKCGWSVAGAGDVDADGHADVIVGMPGDDANGFNSGTAKVYAGADGTVLFVLHGSAGYQSFGDAVAGAQDVDGDGHDDVLIGAPGTNANAGAAFLFSGLDGSVLRSFAGDLPDDIFGHSVAGVGDVNGDGFADVLVGAPLAAGTNAGVVRLYSGKDGSVLRTHEGKAAGDGLGWSLAPAGDVNGDGVVDYVIGAPFNDGAGADAGGAGVYSGRTGAVIYWFDGDAGNVHFGESVSGAGDVNGDGYAEVIVGAPLDDSAFTDAGMARVFSGKDCPADWVNYGPGWPGTNGIPLFTASADPQICTTITLNVGNSLGAYTAAAIIVGINSAYTPTIFDGVLLVSPLTVVSLTLPGGGFPFEAKMPCDTTFCGFAVYLQVLEVDPGASKGVSFSQGLELIIGGRKL